MRNPSDAPPDAPSQVTDSSALTRNHLLKVILLSAATTLEAGCIPQEASNPQRAECADFQLQVEEFWSTGIRAEVLGYSGAGAFEQRKAIVNKMDQSSEDWVRLRQSACMDHKRGLISQDEYKARTACFDKWLQQQRSLVTSIRNGGNLNEAENSLNSVLNNAEQCK